MSFLKSWFDVLYVLLVVVWQWFLYQYFEHFLLDIKFVNCCSINSQAGPSLPILDNQISTMLSSMPVRRLESRSKFMGMLCASFAAFCSFSLIL